MGGSGCVDGLVIHAVLILLWEINRCKSADLQCSYKNECINTA